MKNSTVDYKKSLEDCLKDPDRYFKEARKERLNERQKYLSMLQNAKTLEDIKPIILYLLIMEGEI